MNDNVNTDKHTYVSRQSGWKKQESDDRGETGAVMVVWWSCSCDLRTDTLNFVWTVKYKLENPFIYVTRLTYLLFPITVELDNFDDS